MMTAELQRAELHNVLLRRADWRFLLSIPNPPVVACFADGVLRDAVELIGNRVSSCASAKNSCDLAVAADPDVSTLAAAHAALHPGGWLYAECHSPFSGGAGRVRKALEAAGFADIACYWPTPSARLPRFWLPLEAPGALQHFRDIQDSRVGPISHPARFARRLVWRIAWRLRLIAPVCAIGRRPHDVAAGPPSPALLDLIRDSWPKWGLGSVPEQLSCLLITGGNRSISKCVALIFEEPRAQPRLAVKLARVREAAPALEREAAALNALHSRHTGTLSGIPRVVFSGKQGNHVLLAETAVTGVPLQSVLHRTNFREIAFKAADWLADLAQRTAQAPNRDRHWRIAEAAIGDFGLSFREVADRALLRQTYDVLAAIGPLPVVSEQRDFSPWNVLLDTRGALIVLDWESAELEGLPALDLIYFMTYLALAFDNVPIDATSPRLRRSYRRMLDPTTFTGGVWKACLTHYAGRLGLDPEHLRLLAALTWLIHSRSDYRRYVADVGGLPDQTTLRRSVFLSLWEEEMKTRTRTACDIDSKLRSLAMSLAAYRRAWTSRN